MRCVGELFVGSSAEEGADFQIQVHAECDAGPLGDCGFHEHLTEHDGEQTWEITFTEMAALQERHLTHSRRPA